MEITFQLEDNKHINILNEKGEHIGEIFTPGGSGEVWTNSIQICGFEEAFDLWGCACYERPSYKDGEYIYEGEHLGGNKNIKKYELVKDINLQFGLESRKRDVTHYRHNHEWQNCYKCFNNPCTCEVKIKYENPYIAKAHSDLYLERKDGLKEEKTISSPNTATVIKKNEKENGNKRNKTSDGND
jgi:hypothetical protein